MDVTKRYRPISYLQTHAEELARELEQEAGAIVITEDGKPSFVCVSFEEYFQDRETDALVRLIEISEQERQRGNFKSLAEARTLLDEQILYRKGNKKADT